MKAAEKAAAMRDAVGANFTDELEAFLLTGFVFSTPDAFIMGRPCPKGILACDAWDTWPPEICNAFFVWLAVGEAWRLFDIAAQELNPGHLPWVGFFRQGRGRTEISWLPTAILGRRLHFFGSSQHLPLNGKPDTARG